MGILDELRAQRDAAKAALAQKEKEIREAEAAEKLREALLNRCGDAGKEVQMAEQGIDETEAQIKELQGKLKTLQNIRRDALSECVTMQDDKGVRLLTEEEARKIGYTPAPAATKKRNGSGAGVNVEKVKEVLTGGAEMRQSEIASAAGLSTRQVNSVLYALSHRESPEVENIGGHWRLVDTGE